MGDVSKMSMLKAVIENLKSKTSGTMPENTVNLTWEEAKTLMSMGLKMTHKYFTDEEFFYMYEGKLLCEQGYDVSLWYIGEVWQESGWRIYNG